jgi:hypothetical protein
MTLDERLALRARTRRARAGWLRLEEEAVELGDEELDSRVAIARLAILDVADRLEQLCGLHDLGLDEVVA